MNAVLKKLQKIGIVPVVKIDRAEDAIPLAKALCAGGLPCAEVTFRTGAAAAAIKAMTENFPQMCVGAGTVLNVEQVHAAYEAGAKYIISPNTNEAVIKETVKLGMISIPGAMTPTEIEQAYSWGAHIVKLFPADDLGAHYIKNVTAPLSHIPLMATGGVNPQTIPEYYAAGAKAFGTGITILKPEYVQAENYEGIKELAKAHIDAVNSL